MNESLERCARQATDSQLDKAFGRKKRESLAGEERKQDEKKMGLC